jgi:hypothetical protein
MSRQLGIVPQEEFTTKRRKSMFKRNFIAFSAALVILAMITLTSGSGTATAGECQPVTGHISSQLLTEGCTSPVGLCTIGRFRGDIRGEFVFTATSLNPTANPDFAQTSIAFYTGDLLLQTRNGNLTLKDAGAFNIASDGNGDFASVQTIIGGTGNLVHTTGRIRTEGIFIGGCVDCRYRGEICIQ